MDFYSFGPIAAVLDAAYSLVSTIAEALAPIAGSASAAVAVVLITLLVRTALIPVGVSQVRAEISRRRLAPKLRELQRKYKNNRELLQRKTMELYTVEKASPLAGCLPALAQAPVVSIVYALFILPTINGHVNGLLVEQLFGVPLGTSLVALIAQGALWPGGLLFLVLLVAIAGVASMSRVVQLRQAPMGTDAAAPGMQNLAATLSWLPFLTVVFAAIVPLAATLYLTVTTSWTLAERVLLRGVFERGNFRRSSVTPSS